MNRTPSPSADWPEQRVGLSLREGLAYHGGIGQWAWVLHRAAGVGVLLFLMLHITDIFLASFGPGLFNQLVFIYHSWYLRPFIALLVFGVMYHALNGVRIIAIDFYPPATAYQRQLWTGAFVISLIVTGISIASWFVGGG